MQRYDIDRNHLQNTMVVVSRLKNVRLFVTFNFVMYYIYRCVQSVSSLLIQQLCSILQCIILLYYVQSVSTLLIEYNVLHYIVLDEHYVASQVTILLNVMQRLMLDILSYHSYYVRRLMCIKWIHRHSEMTLNCLVLTDVIPHQIESLDN